MARAQGSRAQMALAFETTDGTPPVSGFTKMPFASTTLGADPALDVSPPSVQEVEVTRLQAKAALLRMGLLDQVEALVGNLDQMTRLAWAEATTFRRDSPLLNALGPYLVWPDGTALSEADLDALFALAETIEV